MKRNNQEVMARVLRIANKLADSGVLFVPIPVLNDAELPDLLEECQRRIALMESCSNRTGKEGE